MKKKICANCGEENYLYARKMCKLCDMKVNPHKHGFKPSEGLSSKTTLPIKKRKRIAPISDKLANKLKLYRKVRDQFLKDNPICMYPGCSSREVECHHAAGKVGKLLTDVRYFKALCRVHHRIAEEQPDHAKELGLSTTRLDK